jgi:hypothetical protein
MVFAASVVGIAVATLMLWGWGSAFQRMFGLERANWPATVAVGLAAVVFLGGILNLARLAVPWALALVAASGIYLALRERIVFEMPAAPVALVVAVVMIFTIATQLPPGMYNGHDDFQKYFAYPVRMLETGTVFGSPLSAMGTQTLGAQAFLDAFVVALFPIVYINGVDAIFGLFLSMMLASGLSPGKRNHPLHDCRGSIGLWNPDTQPNLAAQLLGVASVAIIDPQYANISTLYCGSALIMASATVPGAAAVGLLYAALIAMKPTFAVFVAIHFLATLRGVREALRTALATAGFLLPWVLVHAPNYLRTKAFAPALVRGDVLRDSLNLFSFAPLEYGASAASYTLLIVAMGVCGAICFRERNALAAAGTGIATFFVLIYVLGPLQAGCEQSLRYFAPVAIGLSPAIFGWAGARSRLALIVASISLAAFSPSLWTRAHSAWKYHSAWSYALSTADQDYIEYMERVLKGPERDAVKALQEKVPAGETILTWINAPFYLDYKRNKIIDIDPAGIGNAWARIPEAQYLIWDYNGFATRDEEWYRKQTLDVGAGERRNASLTLDFLKKLEGVVAGGEVVYDNGEVKVVRLPLPASSFTTSGCRRGNVTG